MDKELFCLSGVDGATIRDIRRWFKFSARKPVLFLWLFVPGSKP